MIKIEKFRSEMKLAADRDAELEDLLDEVVEMFEDATARLWKSRTGHVQTFTAQGDRDRIVFLELWPITSITQVRVRGDWDEDWTVLASDKYVLVGRRRLRRVNDYWEPLVEVTYDGGVTLASPSIQAALIAQAKFLEARLDQDIVVTQSENFEGGKGVLLRPDHHPLFAKTVRRYRRKA